MTVPNIQTIDLVATIRDISPNPTCDVSFTFVDQTTGETSTLSAHKLVLACGSPVFMTQFYGPIREKKDCIPIEDSCFDTFKVFLDILYNKKVLLKDMDFQVLGELFYLANKYFLDMLKDSIVQEVLSRKIVTEQVLEVAKVAEANVHLEKFSDALYQICNSFLSDNAESAMEICDNEEVGEENSFTIHRMLARVNRTKKSTPPPAPGCDNCKHGPCLNEEMLTINNFVAGSLIGYIDYDDDDFKRRAVQHDGSQVTYTFNDTDKLFVADISRFKFRC
eukprot:GFUD01016847.1.p1 GENE.GFUD01016847.1~~GFUD01016847.1.p1  ORF type:complete len:299 (-),score=63.36 GFUD01016847.1:101-934(-)